MPEPNHEPPKERFHPGRDDQGIARLAALLDFYSDRAVAHASFFIASIFGLITFSSISTELNAGEIYWYLAIFLFLGFAYAGHHTLLRFGYYAFISQEIVGRGLWQKALFESTWFDEEKGAGETNLQEWINELNKKHNQYSLSYYIKKLIPKGASILNDNRVVFAVYWLFIIILFCIVFL